MALSDYTPTLAWFADSLADLDIPTGTTKSNPGSTTDPTLAGTPDSYADFDGTDGINFLPATPVMETNLGDMTLVIKARIDTLTANDVLFSNYDGSGVSGDAHGLQIAIESALGRISLRTPPRSTGFRLENDEDTHALVASQDFIMAFRRDDNVWTLFADVDATGGMTQDASPQTNAIGASAEITECGDVTIGCDRDGANGFDGRVYWVLGFDAAISDTDLALADWTDEANLKAVWLAAGGTVNTETLESTISVTDEPLDYVFYNRALDSNVTLFDEFIATLVGTISRILTDTLSVDDGAVLFYRRNRMLDDVIVVTEGTLEQYTTTNIVMDDTIDVVDSVIRYLQFRRLGESAVAITDSLISAIINYVVNVTTLSSTIEVTDDEEHFVYVTRLVESTLGLFDESQSSLLRFILLTDALSVDDSATATYVPDPGTPGQVFNPAIRIGFDQPRIELGGYAVI